MEATALALRKCSHVLTSSASITERKRNVEVFVELLRETRTHQYLDQQVEDENNHKSALTWNELFNIIQEYTVDELLSIRSKASKAPIADTKYQEAIKLFRAIIENANTRGPQLDPRSLVDSVITLITDEQWLSCPVVLKELSHLLTSHVLNIHRYANELSEQQWIDLCKLYMSLTNKTNTSRECDQAFYSPCLKFIVEKLVIYQDLHQTGVKFRKELFDFLRAQFEELKNSNHFSVIENFLCVLNSWSFKYVFDMPDEVCGLANQLLPCLINIWRKKCNDRPKTEIIKFIRLQISLHHPNHEKYHSEDLDDTWMKTLQDLNDLILRDIDDLLLKQRSNSRMEQTEFFIRSDFLHLASSVFYQVSSNELATKTESEEKDELFEPSAKRTRYDLSTALTSTNQRQMNSFQNLFQSADPQHQAVGFQILSLQIERQMKILPHACDFYFQVLKRYLSDERKPCFLANALRCLRLLLRITSDDHLIKFDLIPLIQPLIHLSSCEPYVIDLLAKRNLSLSIFYSCSSSHALKHLFRLLNSNPNYSYPSEEENRLLEKLMPDLISSYRDSEHDLATFFSAPSPDFTPIYASILMQLSSFDSLPCRTNLFPKASSKTEFDQIEMEWSRLKLLRRLDDTFDQDCVAVIESDFHTTLNHCQLNIIRFKRLIEIYGKNVRFLHQLNDRPAGERCPLILHWAFLGIHMLRIFQLYFILSPSDDQYLSPLIEHVQILFNDLTNEMTTLRKKNGNIPFISDLLEHIRNVCYISSSSSLLKSISPHLNTVPSVIYGFLQLEFLKDLYKVAFPDVENKSSADQDVIGCPMDNLMESSAPMQAFEILLLLCYQALYDQPNESKSMLVKYGLDYQLMINSLIRLLEQKIYLHLEELPLPDSMSYRYLDRFLSHLCSSSSNFYLNLRCNDFEFLSNLFSELFRHYRRDNRLCQQIMSFFNLFLRRIYRKISTRLATNSFWLHLKKLIDAFWQMIRQEHCPLTAQLRRSIIQIKQLLIKDDEINIEEIENLLDDPSYAVRSETNRLISYLFYEQDNVIQVMETQNENEENTHQSQNEDRSSLGIYLGLKDITDEQHFHHDLRLKTSNEQEKIYRYLIDHHSLSPSLLCYLAQRSEYLSRQAAFQLLQLGMDEKLSSETVQHLLPDVPVEYLVQSWQRASKYSLDHFPWDFLSITSTESYYSFIYAIYFLASQQVDGLFPEKKLALIEYFAEVQAFLLPISVNEKTIEKQKQKARHTRDQLLSKTEYQRLMKQKSTMIVYHLLLTYTNDGQSPFDDPWKPEPIGPAHSWSMLRDAFEQIRQTTNAKTFLEYLLKNADIGDILLGVATKIFSTASLHEHLRLLDVFSQFITEILFNSLDYDYFQSILRDSTYILLRYIEKYAEQERREIYQEELHEKILQLVCQCLHQLCLKGLESDSAIYLHHIPDLVRIFIHHQKTLTEQRIRPIFEQIYQSIRNLFDPISIFISYIIEKLGYVKCDMKSKSRNITTFNYLSFLSDRPTSLPMQWILEMFHEHLESERERPEQPIDSALISSVKQQLIHCIHLKHHQKLAGQCLAKFAPFSTDNNAMRNDDLSEDHYETIPFWIIDDLLLCYLVDENQIVVECTRSTLKNIFLHPMGQELFHKHPQNRLIEIYSIPFLNVSNTSATKASSKRSEAVINPWLIPSAASFDQWLISLVNHLFRQIEFYYEEKSENGHPYALIFLQLKPLVELKIDLAKKVFPHLIYSLLLLPTTYQLRPLLSKQVTSLLEQLLERDDLSISMPIAKLLFRTINYLRQCPIENLNKRNSGKNTFLNFENHFWLELDYFQLAKCASKYQCHQSALIYTDIWTTKQRSLQPVNNYSIHIYQSDIELFSSSDLIDVFVGIHSTTNRSDEFYGLEKHFQNRSNLYGEFYQLTNSPYDALFYYDQGGRTMNQSKIIQALRFCGFNHILEQYLHQISSFSNDIFFRIQLSSILSQPNTLTQWSTHSKQHDQSSKSIRENILSIIERSVQSSKSSNLPILSSDHLWSNVTDLRECSLINVLDDVATNYHNPSRLAHLWISPDQNQIRNSAFDHNDELLLTRIAAAQKFLLSENQDQREEVSKGKQKLLSDLVTQLCENALEAKKLQLCDRYLSDLTPLIDPSHAHQLSLLRAKVLVLRQQDTAGEYLRQLIESPLPSSIQIRCRLLLCDWLTETRCETSATIKEQLDIIAESVSKLDTSALPLMFDSYLAMAKFSDNEYQRLNQLFQSPMFENKRLLIARNQVEYNKQEKLDPAGRYTKNLKRSLDMDKFEIEEQKKLQYRYLILTLQNYLVCLKLYSSLSKRQRSNPSSLGESMKNHSSMPEIMLTSKCLSYWLTNSNNDDVNRTLKKYLAQIPTHFFLPFVYQMAARMALTTDKTSSVFHSILLEYLSKCIVDHPHHVLPVIFALANAHKDAHINNQPSMSAVKKTSMGLGLISLNNEISNDARSQAAHYLLEQCAKAKPLLVDQMRILNDAYIEAAYWDAPTAKADQQGKDANGKGPNFSKSLRLMHIKDLHEVAVPTVTIPVATDGIYRTIETVKSFQPEYTMVGGVNAPKKIICNSSSGRPLPQLLKGKDDLRQDAVMQQLFTVVNRLLEKDNLTSHRSLQIRTYKVVPLTQKSGVLEWCEGTITFGDYLTKDPDGAHSRYHPEDWSAMDCRRHIHKIPHTDTAARRQAFTQICSKLQPVFRYFFYEYFNQPSLWHKSKQAYAKSVATSSIVGYIVGLGDRHVQNILIDTQTAEVIHIDLGVAFDQGKMLPIPEKIPFRLTRDVIDGLGICGTEGLFKKTCEVTLELMRHYADTLITIIEVFLYDPLYQWQLSPQKALQLQQQLDKLNNDTVSSGSRRSSGKVATGSTSSTPSSSIIPLNGANESTSTDTNKMAERLLLGLRQKLQGVERFSQMTIKAHVNMLIQEATSIDNLSQLFAGWQPYL